MVYTTLMTVKRKKEVFTPAPTNLVGVAGTLKATLTWTSATGESGVTWSEEKLVRKEGSAPSNSLDGTVVTTITTKDTYATNGYEDTGLDSTKTYYYKVFAVYDNGTERGSTDVNVTPNEYEFVPGANTIAYYPLTSTTTVNDKSGNNHTMTQNGGTFGTYQGVSCLSLSANNYLSCAISQLPQGNNPITISCWCWLNNVSGEQGIFGYGRNSTHGSFQLMYDKDGRLGIRTYMDDCKILGNSPYLGKWIHITGTSDGSSINFYIDGQVKATKSHSQNMQDVTLYIGKGIVSNGMTGYISNAIIENKARTAEEVASYYNGMKSKYGL